MVMWPDQRSLALFYRSRNCELGSFKVYGGVGAGHLPRAGPRKSRQMTTKPEVAPPAADRDTRPAYAQNGETYSPMDQYRQHKALFAWAQPHHHAAVPTRSACRMAAESCQNTSAAAAQLHTTPCPPRSSKVKVVERQEQRRTLRDRPAPSAPLLCRASSLAAL